LAATSDIDGIVDTSYLSVQQIANQTLKLSSAELGKAIVSTMQRRMIIMSEVTVGKASKEVMKMVLDTF
jgi:hypothetical protein